MRVGVGAGDAVAIMLRNDFPFFEATFGAGRLGAHAVPINWHYMAEETGHILEDSGAKVLVIHADLLPQIEGRGPGRRHGARRGDPARDREGLRDRPGADGGSRGPASTGTPGSRDSPSGSSHRAIHPAP